VEPPSRRFSEESMSDAALSLQKLHPAARVLDSKL
jgi:hypothetical protein